MGELHLEIIVDRLKREFKVECDVGAPQVSDGCGSFGAAPVAFPQRRAGLCAARCAFFDQ